MFLYILTKYFVFSHCLIPLPFNIYSNNSWFYILVHLRIPRGVSLKNVNITQVKDKTGDFISYFRERVGAYLLYSCICQALARLCLRLGVNYDLKKLYGCLVNKGWTVVSLQYVSLLEWTVLPRISFLHCFTLLPILFAFSTCMYGSHLHGVQYSPMTLHCIQVGGSETWNEPTHVGYSLCSWVSAVLIPPSSLLNCFPCGLQTTSYKDCSASSHTQCI